MATRAKRPSRRPSRRSRLAAQMRHGCGLIRRPNGVQGMAVVKRDERRPGISHKAFDNRPAMSDLRTRMCAHLSDTTKRSFEARILRTAFSRPSPMTDEPAILNEIRLVMLKQ